MARKIRQKNASHIKEQKRQSFEKSLVLENVRPKTENQKKIFSHYFQKKHILVHGLPGTGKTFISLYLALKEMLSDSKVEKVIIIRSAVSARELGFMPGSARDKMRAYEEPYYEICSRLFDRDDAYTQLKMRKMVDFSPTSFLRGLTFENCVVIVDEVQNLNDHEISTVITRMGQNSRIIFCGDFRQSDFATKGQEESGIKNLFKTIRLMPSFTHVEMGINDIVRSGIVKEYLEARTELGLI
jgi:phosphate starvation-inducible PhoH-like protein